MLGKKNAYVWKLHSLTLVVEVWIWGVFYVAKPSQANVPLLFQ